MLQHKGRHGRCNTNVVFSLSLSWEKVKKRFIPIFNQKIKGARYTWINTVARVKNILFIIFSVLKRFQFNWTFFSLVVRYGKIRCKSKSVSYRRSRFHNMCTVMCKYVHCDAFISKIQYLCISPSFPLSDKKHSHMWRRLYFSMCDIFDLYLLTTCDIRISNFLSKTYDNLQQPYKPIFINLINRQPYTDSLAL